MLTHRHLLVVFAMAAALVCGGSNPLRACHLPHNTPNGKADIVHFTLNPGGPCYTTLVGPGSISADFTDAASEKSMVNYEVEIRNPTNGTTGIGVRIDFPNGGTPVEGVVTFDPFSSIFFTIRVEDNPPEVGIWRFTATNTTAGFPFEVDAAVIEYLSVIEGSPGDYTWETTVGQTSFTPGQFFNSLFFELSIVGTLPGDVDGDGVVGVTDFLLLLAAWGACPPPCPPSCPADLDGDCAVGVIDVLNLLANWTP
ncbi:MAG: hypothetical protein ACYSU7_07600 [Planctomycetota bacterium]